MGQDRPRMRTALAQDIRPCIGLERPVRPASDLAGERTAGLRGDPVPVRGRMPPTLPRRPGIDVRITRAQVPSLCGGWIYGAKMTGTPAAALPWLDSSREPSSPEPSRRTGADWRTPTHRFALAGNAARASTRAACKRSRSAPARTEEPLRRSRPRRPAARRRSSSQRRAWRQA